VCGPRTGTGADTTAKATPPRGTRAPETERGVDIPLPMGSSRSISGSFFLPHAPSRSSRRRPTRAFPSRGGQHFEPTTWLAAAWFREGETATASHRTRRECTSTVHRANPDAGGRSTEPSPVRLAYQPPANSTCLSQQTSHQQPGSSTLLSEQTSTGHQPPANRTGCTPRPACYS
jgi:hypothetical protein